MVGGREIGSAFFNNGGILGLDVVSSDVRSVLILGGRRGPDVPGRSHKVCLLSTSRAVEVACSSSGGWAGRGKYDSSSCIVDEGDVLGAGTGCVALSGEITGICGAGGEGFSGANVGALGFNEALGGGRMVPEEGCWGWGTLGTACKDEKVNGASDFVTRGVGCIVGTGGKKEDRVWEDAGLLGW